MSELSPNAQKIFELKYAQKRPNGNLETWEQACARVGEYVARAEENESDRLQYTADFTKLIADRIFIPGGRVLANAGTGIKNLANCFVLPIDDTRQSIYKALGDAAEIFAWGGGIGFNFSNLREQGAMVKTTGGKASGPVSFMELFDTTGEVISQASRRGAQMAILNVDHPDIGKFIQYKSTPNVKSSRILDEFYRAISTDFDGKAVTPILSKILSDNQLTHFNVSVGMLDSFMENYLAGTHYSIPFYNGVRTFINPVEIMELIAKSAWISGDPGLYFIDRANEFSLVPYLGSLDATNPCGEVPLLPYEACVLGSINLSQFVEGKYFDFDYLKFVVHTAVRFLDNIQELNETPVIEVNEAMKDTRRLGLGVMGWADTLAELDIEYDSTNAIYAAEQVASFIQKESWVASANLAKERGTFRKFDREKINWKIHDNLGLEHTDLRNVAVTSIAPTGTIALIADINGSIEPYFSKKYIRNITQGIGNTALDSSIYETKYNNIKTAHDISWQAHINMQAIWQKYTDNAVSKTINMNECATPKDIIDAYTMAWKLGCKGITVYRDKSKVFQILN